MWVDGLDRIHKHRDINLCVDLSATPYYLGRVGQDANRPFPWVVSDFGLVDAIESGLVKIPQLAVRDTSGNTVPGYFNIWRWILPRLTPAERGGRLARVKPEAVLKYAHVPARHARRALGCAARGMGTARGREPPARIHHRVQEHRARQGHLSMARRRRRTGGGFRRRVSTNCATSTETCAPSVWTPRWCANPTAGNRNPTPTGGCV